MQDVDWICRERVKGDRSANLGGAARARHEVHLHGRLREVDALRGALVAEQVGGHVERQRMLHQRLRATHSVRLRPAMVRMVSQ